MNINNSDLITGLTLARKHINARVALVSNEESCKSVSTLGLLVNSRPPQNVSDIQAHIFQMSLEYARRAEINAAGSAVATIEIAKKILINPSFQYQTQIEGKIFKKSDLPLLIDGIIENSEQDHFIEFIELAGSSRYLVERTPSRFDSIEFIDNFEFNHVSKAIDGTVIMDNARVLIADAYIENESEIRKLLEWSAQEKERILLCCRGFSEDVLHTLAVNRSRGTLFAYALAFPFDENDANTLVDIATILGNDVVSSLKGQLISSLDPSSLPRVEYARLYGNTLAVNDSHARSRVDKLAFNLKEKLETAEPEAIQPLEKRLKRLSGSTMIVRLQSGIDHTLRCERWDLALRTIRAAMRGVIEVKDTNLWPHRKLVPLLSEAIAHQYAYKLVENLKNLASLI